MSNRKIKIYTTLGSPGTVETDVTTLGDLKPQLRSRGIDTSGMKLLIGETRNELSEDVAILPEGDFKLYLVPSQTKSGADNITLAKDLLRAAISLLEDVDSCDKSCDKGSMAKAPMTWDEQEAAKEIHALMFGKTNNEDESEEEEWNS